MYRLNWFECKRAPLDLFVVSPIFCCQRCGTNNTDGYHTIWMMVLAVNQMSCDVFVIWQRQFGKLEVATVKYPQKYYINYNNSQNGTHSCANKILTSILFIFHWTVRTLISNTLLRYQHLSIANRYCLVCFEQIHYFDLTLNNEQNAIKFHQNWHFNDTFMCQLAWKSKWNFSVFCKNCLEVQKFLMFELTRLTKQKIHYSNLNLGFATNK